jgi:hypothetical protein
MRRASSIASDIGLQAIDADRKGDGSSIVWRKVNALTTPSMAIAIQAE